MSLFHLLVQFSCLIAVTTAIPNSKRAADHHSTEYDIIVVGSGAGGLVAATKFAEAGLQTLLLEVGGPMYYVDGNREIPPWSLSLYPNNTLTRHDAMLYYKASMPTSSGAQYYCTNIPDGQEAACELGGGTSVNGAQQFWPPKRYLENTYGEFDGWGTDEWQSAIERVVERVPISNFWSADNKYYYDQVYDLLSPILTSLNITEIDTIHDPNNLYNHFGRDVFSVSDGLRGGPVLGYLQAAKKLPNFRLQLHSRVTSVVRTGPHITGVIVNGSTIAGKNVVLSAGAWNTPALLFASGIGPETVLRAAASVNYTTYAQGDWILNNGVGANLHDNPQINIGITINDTGLAPTFNESYPLTGVGLDPAYVSQYFTTHSGPLAGIGRLLSGWFEIPYSSNSTVGGGDGDGEHYMVVQTLCSTPTTTNGSFACQWNLNEGALSRGQVVFNATSGKPAFGAGAGVGPWLTDPEGVDVAAMAKGLQTFVDAIRATPGFTVTSPAAGVTDYVGFLKTTKVGNNHWGGSCTLGPTDGTKRGSDCVDLDARVYGTDNLFVVDGSLSRAPTTSNPVFLYEAIAELVSERILGVVG